MREACLGEGIYVEIFDLEKGFIVAHKSLKDIKKCKYETLYEDWWNLHLASSQLLELKYYTWTYKK